MAVAVEAPALIWTNEIVVAVEATGVGAGVGAVVGVEAGVGLGVGVVAARGVFDGRTERSSVIAPR